ncbi:MAG: Polyprenol monophosphomannose synthase [bacterium]|nr:Polyprenol monophosphomannose synthase [bacterium]
MFGSILLILPTYNERENLASLVEEILALKIPGLEILIVDDQSPDGTGEIAESLSRDRPEVLVIHRKPPRGRGLAGIEGFVLARDQGYEAAVEMDADFSHPPRYLPNLLGLFKEVPGIDLAIGSRYIPGGKIEGWPRWRHWNSAVANWVARRALGLKARDCTSGYRCFTRRALLAIPWESLSATGPAIVEEVLMHFERAGLSHSETPITFVERQRGTSKVTPMTILRWLRELGRFRRG